MSKRSGRAERSDARAARQLVAAEKIIDGHPLFAPFHWKFGIWRVPLGTATWSTVSVDGRVRCDSRLAETDEWVWVIAHQLCHLGMGHLADGQRIERDGQIDSRWNAACCVEVNRFLSHLKIGRCPLLIADLPEGDRESLWKRWRDETPAAADRGLYGVAEHGDLLAVRSSGRSEWEDLFAVGLRAAVSAAVEVAGGERDHLSGVAGHKSPWRQALEWFVASYPLLGGVAAGIHLVEDEEKCRTHQIRTAAVDVMSAEIIVNPHAVLNPAGYRFVIAHEILHAVLRHDTRLAGRDPWMWSVATDLVINGWLVEMAVGEIPTGALHDAALKGWSADEVYENVSTHVRRYRKAATFAGVGLGDVLAESEGRRTIDPDAFYRRALANGLDYHTASARGPLPSGLVEEIRARSHPPIGWDVELAHWFDDWLPPADRRRTYARASRRQSVTPDIPRPSLIRPEEWELTRIFGVVIDTSGSMGPDLLGKALGAVSSYSAARDVARARVIFCDVVAYDAGWLAPGDIAGRVRVRGRGRTVLQPGIDRLERADDFPATGPILVITDTDCDDVRVRRDHAFLVPQGRRLPFNPQAPVFRMS